MPRRARLTLPNVPQHIITRGNNRQLCFFADEDYRFFLEWLKTCAKETACQIHAWVLMAISRWATAQAECRKWGCAAWAKP